MKRRVLTTFKILAVTVTAAGCSRAVAPDAHPEPPPPVTRAAEVPPAPSVDLDGLRVELDALPPEEAARQTAHFRPLCDADGYPLVGNVMRKGPSGMQPSALCGLVRGAK